MAEYYNLSKAVPGRISWITNNHPSIEVHTVEGGINTGVAWQPMLQPARFPGEVERGGPASPVDASGWVRSSKGSRLRRQMKGGIHQESESR